MTEQSRTESSSTEPRRAGSTGTESPGSEATGTETTGSETTGSERSDPTSQRRGQHGSPAQRPARHRNVERVVEAGARLGVDVVPVSFPDGTKTAQDAADAIGVSVGQIVKSLIFAVDGEVVLAYVSGANQLDENRLAEAAGGLTCARVDADVVRNATGFPIGGVPPFGHATELRVFVDPDLLQYDEVWAAAGTWHDVFAIRPDQLVAASSGTVTPLRRG